MSDTINWKDHESQELKVYPEATYHVRIENWARGVVARSGNKQIRFRARIIDGQYSCGAIFDHAVLTANAIWKVAKIVQKAGIDLKTLPKMEIDSQAFDDVLETCKGRTMYWAVREKSYNGAVSNEVYDYKVDDEQPTILFAGGGIDEKELPDFLREG
jgi:hypothetical protein